MRGGTAFSIVGTMGAEVEAFLRIRPLFFECFRSYRPSSVRATPCQLPRRGSSCSVLSGAGVIGTPQGGSQNLPHRGRGTARRRWMRGGTAFCIVETMGAEVEAFLRIRPLFFECFRSHRPSSVRAAPCQLPRRGSFCSGLWGAGIYWEQFRAFTCGTAHRPFPTVSLIGGRFSTEGF